MIMMLIAPRTCPRLPACLPRPRGWVLSRFLRNLNPKTENEITHILFTTITSRIEGDDYRI